MKTAKLYQEDVYMKTADGNIMEVIVTPKETLLATDISIFFPEGGGHHTINRHQAIFQF